MTWQPAWVKSLPSFLMARLTFSTVLELEVVVEGNGDLSAWNSQLLQVNQALRLLAIPLKMPGRQLLHTQAQGKPLSWHLRR